MQAKGMMQLDEHYQESRRVTPFVREAERPSRPKSTRDGREQNNDAKSRIKHRSDRRTQNDPGIRADSLRQR